ncbi:hypothetical protein H1R20_g9598, partial [Candolleomyces eurysporus]
MLRNLRTATSPAFRCLYSTAAEKPSLKLVAELRKRTEVSIVKAREALSASGNDVDAALDWLQKDLVASGAKKAAKVGGRATNEGLISTSVLSNSPRTFSDKRDETERRLVRAGVRIFDGGAFDPDELDQDTGRIRKDFDSDMSSSGTVSGCRVNRDDNDSMSDRDVLRMVALLVFW